MSFSLILTLYSAASAVAAPFAGLWLSQRAAAGKEDRARLSERFGRYTQARPRGRVVWLHGASVGESGVALQIAEALAARDSTLSFVLTSGTRTSAALIAKRLPARATHVYAPIDRPSAVRRFLTHWRPDLGVFVESELWPHLILETQAAAIPLALVNARMSPKSLGRWTRWRAAGRRLLEAFTIVLAADQRTAAALSQLRTAPAPVVGNLKLAADPPASDLPARAAFAAEIGARKVWLAASTHAGEDDILLAAHALLRAQFSDALLIIAPRHPERGAAIAALAGNAPRRAQNQPIGAASVYIADTMGELGMFYALAPVAFIAGSLLPHLKGHNPAEPAKLNAAIITGPHVESFQDLFSALIAANGATQADNAEAIAQTVSALWRDETLRARSIAAARTVVNQGAAALDDTVTRLSALLPAPAIEARADAPA
ncbi:MAG: 3-deoxy-D-manno-octulosonic acid transferase [Terricaulis sp.]